MQTLEIIYRSQTITIEYFLRSSEEQKEVILYLHGLGCCKSDFLNATQSELFRDYTLLAIDFPGHGGSSYPEKGDMNDLVEITKLVLEKLGIRTIILIGHSMGGLVALLFADTYLEKVKALINVEGNFTSDDCFFSRQVTLTDYQIFDRENFENFKIKLRGSNNIGFQIYADTLDQYKPARAFYDYSYSLVQHSDSGVLLDMFLSLHIPKLFVYGSENSELPYIPTLKQKCETAEISKSNHFPQHDNPMEFYNRISEFLNRL